MRQQQKQMHQNANQSSELHRAVSISLHLSPHERLRRFRHNRPFTSPTLTARYASCRRAVRKRAALRLFITFPIGEMRLMR